MIPAAYITHWKDFAPWPTDAQVEQDLVISRALVEIFNHDLLKTIVAFRGGTALHKIFLPSPSRYSEDIDLVFVKSFGYDAIIKALRDALKPWLGKDEWEKKSDKLILRFNFQSEIEPVQNMKLKVEIHTKECFSVLGLIDKDYSVDSPWFKGKTKIKTFVAEELMGTKLRALYQRKKGRDLFDIEQAHNDLKLNPDQVVDCFKQYLAKEEKKVSRAQFDENLEIKKNSEKFLNDIHPLLRPGQSYNMTTGFKLLESKYIPKLPGDPWKGKS